MSKSLYTIRQVISITGISEYILRVWENRYQAFYPARTKTGRRLYSSQDLKRAKALHDLTKQGFRIGQIAKLPLNQLEELLGSQSFEGLIQSSSHDSLSVEKILLLAHRYHWAEVRKLISKKRNKLSAESFITDFIIPLLGVIAKEVETEKLSIAQEHILSAMIREYVGSIPFKKSTKPTFRMVFAAPEGDYHELGILIASKFAALRGMDSLMLGGNMPKSELAEACVRYGATHVVLSSNISKRQGAEDELFAYINFLDKNLSSKVKLWIGGANTKHLSLGLSREYQIFSSFYEFIETLD